MYMNGWCHSQLVARELNEPNKIYIAIQFECRVESNSFTRVFISLKNIYCNENINAHEYLVVIFVNTIVRSIDCETT